MKLALVTLAAVALIASLSSGCSKRQIVPISLAGAGAVLVTSGFVYRATLPEADSNELLGRSPRQKAITSVLIFGGAALILTGVILSITTPICETDGDCFGSDACDVKTGTCVAAPLAKPAPESAAFAPRSPLCSLPPFQPERFALELRSHTL